MSRRQVVAEALRKYDQAAPAPAPDEDSPRAGDWGDRSAPLGEDFAALVQAHATAELGDDEDALPTSWTPALVQQRMVEAFDTLARTVGRVGPKPFGGCWPGHIRDYPPESTSDRSAPGAHMISRAEEALMWPLLFLKGEPKQSDALMLFCSAKADGDAVVRILRDRATRGKVGAEAVIRHNKARRGALARAVASRVNQRMAALDRRTLAARIAIIREKALDDLRAAIEGEGGLPLDLRPSDVMPGKVLSRTRLDHFRKLAAATIARALNEGGVVVR